MYTCTLTDLRVGFLFTTFEEDVMKAINVASLQLHPKNRAFMKGFEIFYKALDIAPTIGILFFVYVTKQVNKGRCVSLNALDG